MNSAARHRPRRTAKPGPTSAPCPLPDTTAPPRRIGEVLPSVLARYGLEWDGKPVERQPAQPALADVRPRSTPIAATRITAFAEAASVGC